MSETDTHVYFVGGPFSQWFNSPFEGRLDPQGPDLEFCTAEQYMMAGKAWLFQDLDTLEKIMASFSPREQKALGRQVHGQAGGAWTSEDVALWNTHARNIVRRGNFYKFQQNPTLEEFLMGYRTHYIVEGADYDAVWGVKLAWDDPRILDPKNWRGTNWLGECIMEVRKVLESEVDCSLLGYVFDPFQWKYVTPAEPT